MEGSDQKHLNLLINFNITRNGKRVPSLLCSLAVISVMSMAKGGWMSSVH